tara:strand:+ start:6728 stop:8539 length:1812 start_codon:yes stop_codon:yes gene_type:complete
MPAIITSKFRFHNAEQFKESFSEAAASNYYLFIGRPSEFSTATGGGTDSAPPTPVDNRTSEGNHWDAMMAAKKIPSTGVSHAIPRRDLDTSGSTTYDMYRPNYSSSTTAKSGATNLFDSTFYFMTSAYRVYKVLNNGSSFGVTGVAFSGGAEPTNMDKNPFEFGGYSLKYMYTLSTQDIQNFLTPDFIPVPTTAETGKNLDDGSINIILITDKGTSSGASIAYSADRVVNNVPIRGDGYGGTCSVTIGGSAGNDDGLVMAVSVSEQGQSYTHASVNSADIIEQYGFQYGSESNNPALIFSVDVPTFEVVIGPDGGHGTNPAKELGGHFIMMDTKLQTTEGYDFSVVNDFRQVGVVRDPYSYGTSSAFTSSTARQTYAIKIASGNSGTFGVDTKISQDLPVQTITSLASNSAGTTFTATTGANHNLVTGQVVTITGGSFTVPSPAAGNTTNGHLGTHHITRDSATQFSYTVGTSRKVNGVQTLSSGVASYTTADPQGIVVEWDDSNRVLFYVRNAYTDQGTDADNQTLPFCGGGTITGQNTAGDAATGTADLTYTQTLNNTVFVAGYANPEIQPDSGDVIYVENRKPISRASDQTEDIKLIVEF